MKHFFMLFIFQLLLINNWLFSQQTKPQVAKEPSWITLNNIDYYKTNLDKTARDGYIDISFEKQVSLADQSRYYRSSKKIISGAGVQNGSEVSVSYDPTYEQLFFHSIRIIRKKEILNKLELSKFKVVHQEQELTDFIYNGLLNAVLILEDVRQGDIIEYSYTIKGFNPIFKNKYADTYSLNFDIPLYQVFYKLIVPPGRKINFRYFNQPPAELISNVNGQQVYEWRSNDIPLVTMQDYVPSWYDPYAQIVVSEFNNWKEVNDWAMELFPQKKSLSSPLQKKIAEIAKAYPGANERTSAALRFVQDEIRYMGIEMGQNSHRPADPSKVFAQRFGDCKEKSYLLCCMLNTMGIEARPVLINTVTKKNLNGLLPAPNSFDHVTVRVKLDDEFYWFDPTIAYQRGDIKNIFYPDYQTGLVVSSNTDSLTTIAFRNISSVQVKEYFKVGAMAGSGILKVTTSYQGSHADDARDDFNNESVTDKLTEYQKFYAAFYEDIIADSLTFTDNDSTGIFTTTEYYSIPNFWTTDKGELKRFTFSSFVINSIIRKPKDKKRTMPFSLVYPAKYKEEVIIELPRDWKVTEDDLHVRNNSFVINNKFYCIYNQVHLDTDFENLKDHTSATESLQYFKELDKVDEFAGFEITSGDNTLADKNSAASSIKALTFVLIIGAFAGGVIWFGKKNRA